MTSFEQWGFGQVDSFEEASGCIDLHHGEAIFELFAPFIRKLADPNWREIFQHMLYWSMRAEPEGAGADGGCILLQAALERLSWHLLVREQKSLSEDGFKKLDAADQLKLMLTVLRIPKDVPSELVNLTAYAKGRSMDGPTVFTNIRNRIVHPPKLNAKKDELPYYEAYLLAKWYLELAVLSVCGYNGKYANRTHGLRYTGQVEDVPWL